MEVKARLLVGSLDQGRLGSFFGLKRSVQFNLKALCKRVVELKVALEDV